MTGRIPAFRPSHSQRGTSALEMAAILPFLLVLLTAMLDHAWLVLVQQQMSHAAREASRYGITGRSDALPTDGQGNPVPLVQMCDGGAPTSDRVDKIRAIVARHAGVVLRPEGLCLRIGAYTGFQAVGQPEPYVDINGNGRWDPGEPFTDINGNGVWDSDQGAPTPGTNEAIAIYTLRYQTRPLTGVTPGLPGDREMMFEARVVVRNEPF
jgi:hypothetical protein